MAAAKKTRVLLVIDRAGGHVERIPESDGNFAESIVWLSRQLKCGPGAVLARLEAGEELATCGFVRRMVWE
jgi:hypothetical protein